jgi:hypothetical protein
MLQDISDMVVALLLNSHLECAILGGKDLDLRPQLLHFGLVDLVFVVLVNVLSIHLVIVHGDKLHFEFAHDGALAQDISE